MSGMALKATFIALYNPSCFLLNSTAIITVFCLSSSVAYSLAFRGSEGHIKMKSGIVRFIGFDGKKENKVGLFLYNLLLVRYSSCHTTLSLFHHPFRFCTHKYTLMALKTINIGNKLLKNQHTCLHYL